MSLYITCLHFPNHFHLVWKVTILSPTAVCQVVSVFKPSKLHAINLTWKWEKKFIPFSNSSSSILCGHSGNVCTSSSIPVIKNNSVVQCITDGNGGVSEVGVNIYRVTNYTLGVDCWRSPWQMNRASLIVSGCFQILWLGGCTYVKLDTVTWSYI